MEKDYLNQLFVIGGSSGSIEVLCTVLPLLRPLTSAAIIIVLHRKSSLDTKLSEVFAMRTPITIKEAEEKDRIQAGCIYIAPADYHLLVEKDGSLSLDVSEKINYSRPSIDVCMETAADAFSQRVIGILLSGANADGVVGLKNIKHHGGFTVAQHPETAEVDYMPQQAIEKGVVDIILRPEEIAGFINNR